MKKKQLLAQAKYIHHTDITLTNTLSISSANGGLFMVREGTIQIQILQKSIRMHASQIALLPSHSECHIQPVTHAEITLWEWDTLILHIRSYDIASSLITSESHQELLSAMRHAHTNHKYEWLHTLSTALLLSLAKHPSIMITDKGQRDAGMECDRIDAYLNLHYADHITLDELAKHFHRNKYAMSHLYKDYKGITIFDTLNQIRLHHALDMIKSKEHSIQEIAAQCGFSSVSYFIQRFSKQYHDTPLQYRKLWLRTQENVRS